MQFFYIQYAAYAVAMTPINMQCIRVVRQQGQKTRTTQCKYAPVILVQNVLCKKSFGISCILCLYECQKVCCNAIDKVEQYDAYTCCFNYHKDYLTCAASSCSGMQWLKYFTRNQQHKNGAKHFSSGCN